MGFLTPTLECMFDVVINKILQELSSFVTKAVQCYMTQRTVDNTLHLHTHIDMHTLHTITNQMSMSIDHFSDMFQ